MKNETKKLNRNDITYLLALLFFAIICMFRFFDKMLRDHHAVFDFMKSYPISILMMFLYFILLFVLFGVLIACCKQENKRNMYYLTAFLSVFSFPMFLPYYYFGNMDMYVWMLGILGCTCIVVEKVPLLVVLICMIMGYISPIATLCCAIIIEVLYLYRYLSKGRKRDLVYCILCCISSILGAGFSICKYGVNFDVQKAMTLEKFWSAIVLFIPYLFLAFLFFKGLIMEKNIKKKIGTIVLIIGLLPSAIINYTQGDYTRVLMYAFMYYIVTISCLYALREEYIEIQMHNIKELIKKYVAIPAIVIAYPLLITTFWYAGTITLFVEQFIGK